jgi:DNA-3-methyladenine glycosylase II
LSSEPGSNTPTNPAIPSVLDDWEKACAHLKGADPRFIPVISAFPGETLSGSGDLFKTLVGAVVGQQISVKAAEAIWLRLGKLLGEVTPRSALRKTIAELRSVGLSYRKAEYLLGIAQALIEEKIHPELWPRMADPRVIAELVSLRGIGEWTAHMILIFYLQRPDVLPVKDIGLLNAAGEFFQLRERIHPQELIKRAEAWRPYRTVATWYLWRKLDPMPIKY